MKNERLMKKRKTLHAVTRESWVHDWATKRAAWRTGTRSKITVPFRWYADFQRFGMVTFCGLRVHTFSKLADTTETINCPACKSGYALSLLANLDA